MPFLRLVASGQRAPRPVQPFVAAPITPLAPPVLTASSGRSSESAEAAPTDRPAPSDPYLPPPLIVPPGGGRPYY